MHFNPFVQHEKRTGTCINPHLHGEIKINLGDIFFTIFTHNRLDCKYMIPAVAMSKMNGTLFDTAEIVIINYNPRS